MGKTGANSEERNRATGPHVILGLLGLAVPEAKAVMPSLF